MTTFWQTWRRWRRFIQRRIDISGLTYLTVALLTIGIVAGTRDALVVCLLLLLPVSLLATFGGWGAGLMGGVVAAILTSPHFGERVPLVHPPLDPEMWMALSFCYLLFGALVGLQGAVIRRQRVARVEEMEEKLQHARASAQRYEAMLEAMSEGQEFLARMNDELAAMNTIATAVNSSLDVQKVQQTALTHLSALLNADEAQIYRISDAGTAFVLQAARPLTDAQVADAPEVPLDAGLLGHLVKGQHAMTLGDDPADMARRPPLISEEVKSLIAVPLRTRSRLFGALVLGRHSGRSFSEDDEKFLGSVSRILAVAIENARLFAQTQELSLVDELTGVANRRMFNLHLGAEVNHARVTGARLCLIFLEIDRFKLVNDTYGHLAGDAVLRWFAQQVQDDIRGSDLFCRYGGDEFALIAPDLTLPDALAVARRICERIAHTSCRLETGESVTVTASAGVAALDAQTQTVEQLIDAADQASYAAKRAGRNCVRAAGETEPVAVD